VTPFRVGGVAIPPGQYEFSDVILSYAFGAQRRASGTIAVQLGEYYDGTIRAVSYSGGRVALTKQFSAEPSLSINHVELPGAEFTQTVVRTRSDYGFSPRMFASALVQYNSTDRSFSSNLRFRWEYQPGSEFFIVFTDERDTRLHGPAALRNHAFAVKINRMLRF
jgi:hypothetical protein